MEAGEENKHVFKTISNQKYNAHLKDIQELAKLNVYLTTHVARHTFATLALTYGIDTATIGSILGHKNIKTTQIYAKIIDKKKQEEMKKFTL
jgi:site-specific recombinase XerD